MKSPSPPPLTTTAEPSEASMKSAPVPPLIVTVLSPSQAAVTRPVNSM